MQKNEEKNGETFKNCMTLNLLKNIQDLRILINNQKINTKKKTKIEIKSLN